MILGAGPINKQFRLMQRCPFNDETQCAWRKGTREDREPIDVNQDFVFAIKRMEMRRIVIVKKHLDDNSEEPGYLRHRRTPF